MTGYSQKVSPLDFRIFDSADALAQHGADIVVHALQQCQREGRTFVLGMAAGASPKGIYRVLARRRKRGEIRFDDCLTFVLDEYYPLSPQSPRSFYQELSIVQDQLAIPEENRSFLKGDIPSSDVSDHCAEYEEKIRRAGGIDLQLLGVGRNGHVGFNEPGADPTSRTRRVQLTQVTRTDAAPSFGILDAVPKYALTMGVGTVLDARSLLLIAVGAHKNHIMTQYATETPTTTIPVTLLRRHRALRILVDTAASPKPS